MSKLSLNLTGISLASALAVGLVATADAQLMTQKSLSPRQMAWPHVSPRPRSRTARADGYNVSAHVVGRNGGEVLGWHARRRHGADKRGDKRR